MSRRSQSSTITPPSQYKNEIEFLRWNEDQIVEFLERLGLITDEEPLNDPDLLLFARVVPTLQQPIQQRFLDRINVPSIETLQTVGNAMVKLIFTNEVSLTIRTSGEMTRLRDSLMNNYQIASYGTTLELCEATNRAKICADNFRSVVGALYFDLYYNKGYGYDALDIIEDWLYTLDPDTLPTLY